MKKYLVVAFVVGQCVQILSGVLENQVYHVVAVNQNGTYNLSDGGWTVEDVPEKYLKPVDQKYCPETN